MDDDNDGQMLEPDHPIAHLSYKDIKTKCIHIGKKNLNDQINIEWIEKVELAIKEHGKMKAKMVAFGHFHRLIFNKLRKNSTFIQ